MKALVYSAPNTFSVTEVPTPKPTGTQVLIRVRACGVCRTDMHIHQGHFLSAFPLIPGHEFAGEVAEIGEAVTSVSVGDRVTADNERQCGACHYCRRGEPLFCENLVAQGVNSPGGFAEYTLVEERQVYKLAGQLSFFEGAMTEPLACAVHGMDVINPRVGDEALIFGAGPTGLLLAQLLRHGGVSNLVMADLSPTKLVLAARFTSAHTIAVNPSDPQEHARVIRERFPRGFDIVIDATGVAVVAESLPEFASHGGKIVYYGVCAEDARIQISPYDVFRRQLTILGSFSQALTFHRAVKLLNGGVISTREMVTHTFPLEGWPDALRMMIEGGEQVKMVITP